MFWTPVYDGRTEIIAEDYDRAYEIAEETPLTDLGWELIDVEYEAEGQS
jgi:hypothetical protein